MKKVQLLIAWAERMGDTARTIGEKNVTLELLIKDALTTVADGGKLTSDQCSAVRDVFPEYAGAWLSGSSGGFSCQ